MLVWLLLDAASLDVVFTRFYWKSDSSVWQSFWGHLKMHVLMLLLNLKTINLRQQLSGKSSTHLYICKYICEHPKLNAVFQN